MLTETCVDKDVDLFTQDSQEKNGNPVKAEEAKLKAKYPGLGQRPGGSDFLMKRLQKGVRCICGVTEMSVHDDFAPNNEVDQFEH